MSARFALIGGACLLVAASLPVGCRPTQEAGKAEDGRDTAGADARGSAGTTTTSGPAAPKGHPLRTRSVGDGRVSISRPLARPGAAAEFSSTEDGFEARNIALRDVVDKVSGFSGPAHFESLPEGRWDVKLHTGGSAELEWPVLKAALEKRFNLEITVTPEPVEIYALRRKAGAPLTVRRATDGDMTGYATAQTSGGFGYKLWSQQMSTLAEIAQEYVDRPVRDETGLKGEWTFELAMDHWKGSETIRPALAKLGLQLVPVTREIAVMRIRKADQP